MSDVAPRRAAELIEGGAQAVDVREAPEWDAGRIAGAVHVELPNLPAESGRLGDPVVFYCRSGERSAMAAAAFRASGREAYTIEGGLIAWRDEGLPMEGEVADRNPLP